MWACPQDPESLAPRRAVWVWVGRAAWGVRHLAGLSFQRESAHYFGYVYFRQVKDSSVKRGYFQKVSRAPLSSTTQRPGRGPGRG